jgi:carbamoyltransferase
VAAILGISAFYHDSAACLVCDGEIVAAAQEEAFSRRKHDPGFPVRASEFCLRSAGIGWDDVDCFGFYELPELKMRRISAAYDHSGSQHRPEQAWLDSWSKRLQPFSG